MWFKNLHLENWMIFQEAHIELEKGAIIGVVGRYIDGQVLEGGKSNRAGKSSLVEAIKFLLYGSGRHRSQTKLINRTALQNGQRMTVSGTLILNDGSEIFIMRGRNPKGDPIIEISGHEGMKWQEANQVLEDIIGFSLKEYENTCYFGQGAIHGFMSSPPKEKRDLILSWLGQERWKNREDYARQQVSTLKPKLEGAKQALAGMTESRSIKDLTEELERAQKVWNDLNKEALKKDEKVEFLWRSLDKIKDQIRIRDSRVSIKKKLKNLNTLLEKAKKAYEERGKIKIQLEHVEEEISQTEIFMLEKIERDSERRSEILAKGNKLSAQIKDIEAKGGICPLLEEHCDRITSIQEKSSFVDELNNLREIYKKINNKINSTKKSYGKKIEKLKAEKTKLNKTFLELNWADPKSIKEDIEELQIELNELGQSNIKIVKPDALELKLEEAKKDLNLARNKAEESSRYCTKISVELEQVQRQAKQKRKLNEQIQIWEKKKTAWNYCQFMFSPRGIPGDYLQSAFQTMEGDINYLLNRIESGIQVEIKPYRETKVWEPSCLACGYDFPSGGKKDCPKCKIPRQKKRQDTLILEIIDSQEGQCSEFDLDSGGGQTLISFAVRLALLLLKIREGKDDPPPVILDEVVGSLDAYHRQAITELVLNVLPSDYGLDQIWWISHIEEVQEVLENKLLVIRDGERSWTEWG